MKLACLFSGGKDSNYALNLASKDNTISCLIYLKSENENSYMFQGVGHECIYYQAKALNIPLIEFNTKGEKEKELDDLYFAIKQAKEEYEIEGVITGAIKSAYQSSRVQKICDELNLWCFNPLWQIDENEFLNSLVKEKFECKIIGVFSYPFTNKILGTSINKEFITKINELQKKFKISPAGEGGEYESIVVDGPLYKKKLQINFENPKMDSENSGTIKIKKIELIEK